MDTKDAKHTGFFEEKPRVNYNFLIKEVLIRLALLTISLIEIFSVAFIYRNEFDLNVTKGNIIGTITFIMLVGAMTGRIKIFIQLNIAAALFAIIMIKFFMGL